MIFQLKVTLEHTGVWRRLLVDEGMTFWQLHQLLQIAFEWDDEHLHEFYFRKAPFHIAEDLNDEDDVIEISSNEPAIIGNKTVNQWNMYLSFDETEELLSDWFIDLKDSCLYTYDFGDDWKHRIVLEKILAPDHELDYPHCLAGENEAPEEDSGLWHATSKHADEDEVRSRINETVARYGQSLNGPDFERRKADSIAKAEQWRKLFQLTIQYNKLKPWEWMDDTMVFAVKDAHTGIMGYCSVLGAGDELYGLAVSRGNEGLSMLTRLMHGDVDSDTMRYEDNSILLSLEDRSDLPEEHYILTQFADVRFRGKNSWPCFLSRRPGFAQWTLDPDEVIFMSNMLEQAIVVATRFRENPYLFHSKRPNQFFTRVPKLEHDQITWHDDWTSSLPESSVETAIQPQPLHISEFQIASMKKNTPVSTMAWEQGLYHLPAPIQEDEDERPYYPLISISLDPHSQYMIGHQLIEFNDDIANIVQHQFINCIMGVNVRPSLVYVDKERVFSALVKLCEKLGIELQLVEKLHVLDHTYKEMAAMMSDEMP